MSKDVLVDYLPEAKSIAAQIKNANLRTLQPVKTCALFFNIIPPCHFAPAGKVFC
jgi:hypothetical protein